MGEIFNPTTANLFLQAQENYIAALRDDYLRVQEQMKEFKKQFGDYYSPINKDNESWYNITQAPIKEIMSQYGPDVLRSAEGRAKIAQALDSVNYGDLAKLRASAAGAAQYQKVMSDLQAKGLYSPEFQRYVDEKSGHAGFDNWDTLHDGAFTATPASFEDLNTVTGKWFDDMKPTDKGNKGGYQYTGIDAGDLKNVAKVNAQGFLNTPRGAFEYDKAYQLVSEANPLMSEADKKAAAEDMVVNAVVDANREKIFTTKDADPYALEHYRTNEAIRQYNATTGRDKQEDPKYNIFRDADANGHNDVAYDPKQSDILGIKPVSKNISPAWGKDGSMYYTIPNYEMGHLYNAASVNSKSGLVPLKGKFTRESYSFIPTGRFKAKKDSKGRTTYLTHGWTGYRVQSKDAKGNPILDQDGKPMYETKFLMYKGKRVPAYLDVEESAQISHTNTNLQ